MKVILIDSSRDYLAATRRLLAQIMPDVEVTEYDPEQQGPPPHHFDWGLYDLLILSNELGGGEDGLVWLLQFQRLEKFPPTILVAHRGNEYLAAQAIKNGAAEYINREDLDAPRLRSIIRGIFSRLHTSAHSATRLDRDANIVRAIEHAPNRKQPAGEHIGYRFVRLIGQGASSRVYLAERTEDRSTRVLKIIDTHKIHDPLILKRFALEAELIAELESPYVVHLFEHGFTPEYGFIAMEFFTRGDLKQRIEHGIEPLEALSYAVHIAHGLEAIHRCGIIHRDVKPGNIMFRSDDSLALADFGISKRIDDNSEMTRIGSVLGTPNYMSPEQAMGRACSVQSDLYALGVMLFEMLTGQKPYRSDNVAGLVYQHVHAEIPRLPATLTHYQDVLDTLLAKTPDARFSSALAAAQTLRQRIRTDPTLH